MIVCALESDAPACAQHGMGTGQLVGRRAHVHAGVVQDEVLDLDEFAFEPECGGGV
jgi:hypothetical protein